MTRLLSAVLFVVLALLPASVFASAAQARLQGIVRDASGQPLSGASVRLLAPDGSLVSETTSHPDGRWEMPVGSPRPLTLEVAAPGFRPARRVMEATVAQTVIDTSLALAPRTEQVVVTAAADRMPLEVLMDAKQPRQPVPAHDGAEYLESIPGFSTVRKGGSGGDSVFRGMAGSRLAILTDGATILGGCSARMDAPTAYVFPEAFDLITVIKGPQTVKYGTVGSAGTVLFERDRAALLASSWKLNASTTAGAWGRHDEVFDMRAGTPRVYVRGVGSRSAMGDYRDGDGVAVHSAYMRWNTDAAVGWTPDPTTTVELGVNASDGRAAYADRSVDGSKFRRTGTSLLFERRRPGASVSAITASLAYNYVDHIMDNYSLRTFQPSGMSMSPSAMNPDRTTYGGRAAMTWSRPRVTMDAGGDWLVNQHRNRSSMAQDTMPVSTLARVADARFTTAGGFAELDYRPSLRARLVSGVRVDRVGGTDLRDAVALSMMSTVANPTARQHRTDVLTSAFARLEQRVDRLGATAYAGLGRTERFPDYWELMTKESAATVSAFGTRPETTTQLDFGLQAPRGRLGYHASGYVSRIDDFILIESNVMKAAAMGMSRAATIARNVDASTFGAEAGLTHRPSAAWTVDATLAWVRGTNRTDARPLAQLPPLEARLSAQYVRSRLSAAVLVRLAGAQRRVAINQGTIVGQDFRATESFRVISANAGWKLSSVLSVTAGVDNLLNATYAEHISRQSAMIPGFAIQTGQIREPGRMAWVRLAVTR